MNIIKRLRHQFILLATLAVFIIVAGALTLINCMGYYAMRSHVMDTMALISQNGGTMPSRITITDTGRFPGEQYLPGAIWPDDTPEFAYQTRYFSIHVTPSGTISSINVKNIVAFDADEAVEFAREIYNARHDYGFLQHEKAHYGYMRTTGSDGSVLLVVMDVTREFADVHTFRAYSIWFGLMCIILYVIIFAVLSNRAIAPFVKNLENQKRFITNASHELKTPLAIISVNAEAMEMMNGKNEWTEGIRKQVRRLSNLINQLIILSKAGEESKQELSLSDVSLPKLLVTINDEFKLLATDQGKTLKTEPPKTPLTVHSDQKRLSELLRILMDNAVKYCDDGGTITLTAEKKRSSAVITVSNDYKDGKDVDYSRFFERFYRNDESHNSSKKGFGIGLSIAQEIAKLLSAELKVGWKDGIITFSIAMKMQ